MVSLERPTLRLTVDVKNLNEFVTNELLCCAKRCKIEYAHKGSVVNSCDSMFQLRLTFSSLCLGSANVPQTDLRGTQLSLLSGNQRKT